MTPIQCAIDAVKAAGDDLVSNFNMEHQVKMKSRHEVVSEQDIIAEKIIINMIKENFPEHSILSEESGEDYRDPEHLWIIDPLDGTRNYLMGNPLFSVSIALLKDSEPVLGVVYNPYTKELFTAEKGGGSFINDKKIKPSEVSELSKALVTFCHGHSELASQKAIEIYSKLKPICSGLRQLGSAALELCFVAMGRTECIVIPGVHAWDVAAASLIVKEAGGIVTDFSGDKWTLSSKDIVSSNGVIHKKILEALP